MRQQRGQAELVFLHVDHDVQPGYHQQFVLGIQGKHADSRFIGHVLDLSPAGHLMAFHVNQRAKVHDGRVALNDTAQHRPGGDTFHLIRSDVPQGLGRVLCGTGMDDTEIVKRLSVGRDRAAPPFRCSGDSGGFGCEGGRFELCGG